MNKKQTFEEFLAEKHVEMQPEILDDDIPDAFDAWMSDMEQDELVRLADLYGMSRYNSGLKEGSDLIIEAIK